eukprot:TRINITY_DN5992_c0_g3_i2.p2 TRINITY_DN5992_c0_g3~~TRINITY_DN5992_c0_g3_i2.p2  ORF type:complete len:101 (-),score=52.43 TRINITY_DN5992_c0_g3_i2:46-327(-)
MIRRPPRSTHCISSAASDVYKRQLQTLIEETISAKTELEGKTNEMKGQIEEKKKQLELLTALLLELRVSGSAGQEQADGEEASKLGNEHMADA